MEWLQHGYDAPHRKRRPGGLALDVLRCTYYDLRMIRNFGSKETERLFQRQRVARFQAFERTAQRRLAFLNQIRSLDDLKSPGFRLEALRGDRAGQYSIRINDQWRVCFRWRDGDATDVEIVDYH